MRLLSPPQGKSLLASDIASQQVRSVELDNIIRAKRKEISELENVLVNSLSELGKKGSSEEQFWKDRITSLTREVEGLESRRKSALVPLEAKEKELEDRERVLLKREETLTLQEADNDSERQSLEDKLDDVSEREQEATKYSILLNNREFALSLQEKNLKERMDALTAILIESLEDTKVAQTQAAQYKSILKGRDVSITEREKYVEMQERSFANREKKILDQYQTLQRTITEVNLKNERPGLLNSKRTE